MCCFIAAGLKASSLVQRICLRTKDREFLGAEKEKHQNPEKAIARDFDKDFDAKKAAAKGKSYQ